jgi:hypothetical protein
VCNVFYACVDGVSEEYTCASGLWFDEFRGVCNWPGETDRKNCEAGTYCTYYLRTPHSSFLCMIRIQAV